MYIQECSVKCYLELPKKKKKTGSDLSPGNWVNKNKLFVQLYWMKPINNSIGLRVIRRKILQDTLLTGKNRTEDSA